VIAFAYQGQAVFPEIQSEMKRPADFRKSIIGASIFLTSVYLLVGGFGYGVIGPDAPMLYTWDETKNPSQASHL
jgi:amino acid permease